MRTYSLFDQKPKLNFGDRVAVDMARLGSDLGILPGRIVGKGPVNVIDMWIVEFNMELAASYPYRTMLVPHTAFLK